MLWALIHAACVLAEAASEVDGPPEDRQQQCVRLPLTQQSKVSNNLVKTFAVYQNLLFSLPI